MNRTRTICKLLMLSLGLQSFFASGISLQVHPADTIKLLPSVNINALRYHPFYTGSKIQSIDSSLLRNFNQGNLSQVLATQSPIFIKAYGPGMLSTPGFRGGNANHTAVLWNGFNLQSPMNGQSDLSLIPSFLLEQVSVQYGSMATLYGSGNIGGAVHLQTEVNRTVKQSAEIMLGNASYGTYSGGFKYLLNQKKWSMQQKVFAQSAVNNYSYKEFDELQPGYNNSINPKSLPVVRATHASYNTLAWMQEFSIYENPHHKTGIKSWLQSNERNIPSAMHSPPLNALQKDKTLKILADHQYKKGAYETQLRYGFLKDYLYYSDDNIGASESVSDQHILYLDQFVYHNRYLIQMSGMLAQNKARLSTLSHPWQQQKIALFGTFKWFWFKQKWQQQISLRQEWVDGKAIPFIPAYGFTFLFNAHWKIFGNAAKSYRLPSFNDLYWPGMGNPNLKPEEGTHEELSLQSDYTLRNNILKASICAYNKNIQNWIIWLPAGGNLSTPSNVYEVWSRGVEFEWSVKKSINSYTMGFSGMHDYTLASNQKSSIPNDGSLNKQLIYTPKEKHRLTWMASFKGTTLMYQLNYYGIRYVSSDESAWLNPYVYSSVYITQNLHYLKHNWQLQFNIQNLFNQSYQVMLNRPMPLINYQISLHLKL